LLKAGAEGGQAENRRDKIEQEPSQYAASCAGDRSAKRLSIAKRASAILKGLTHVQRRASTE